MSRQEDQAAKVAETISNFDQSSNNVPVADWGTGYRPDPAHITDFLGSDAHNNTTEQAAPDWTGLPWQGGVPPSNHDGESVADDRSLRTMRADLIMLAAAGGASPTLAGPVSVALEDMNYDPAAEVGDIIPDRDQPDSEAETEPPVDEIEPEPEPSVDETEPANDFPPLP